MHRIRTALVAASLVVMGCSSDDTTSPNGSTQFETRLAAAAAAPSTPISASILSLPVTVTNTLPESVSGSACASTVQARRSNTSWTDVTSSSFACIQIAVIVPAGGSATITAVADPAKVKAVLGGSTGTVIFRVQHELAGESRSYQLQSNEVTWTVN